MQRTLAFAALALTFAAVTACSAPQKSHDAMSEMSSGMSSSSDAMAPMAGGDSMAMSSSSAMSSDAMAPMSSSGMAMSK